MDIKEKGYTGADNPNHVYPIFDRILYRICSSCMENDNNIQL